MNIIQYIYCYFFITYEKNSNEQIRKQRINRIYPDDLTTINNRRFESSHYDNNSYNSKSNLSLWV
jgi:hypothetical protein